MQMWHNSNTHLVQEDYFTYMTMCDMLCEKNNASMYIWNINDRCYIPKETKDYYTKLAIQIASVDAENYPKKYIKIDTVDGEHYPNKCASGYCQRYIPIHKGNTMKDDFNGIEEYPKSFEKEYCEEIIRHFDVMARNL